MTEPRVAIVTGAARGIGAATTLRLAASGCTVIAVDRGSDDPRLPYALGTAQQLDETTRRARTPNATHARGAVTATLADATDHDAMQAIVDETHQAARRPRRVRRRRRRDRRRRASVGA